MVYLLNSTHSSSPLLSCTPYYKPFYYQLRLLFCNMVILESENFSYLLHDSGQLRLYDTEFCFVGHLEYSLKAILFSALMPSISSYRNCFVASKISSSLLVFSKCPAVSDPLYARYELPFESFSSKFSYLGCSNSLK
jgi:hypothetical protein